MNPSNLHCRIAVDWHSLATCTQIPPCDVPWFILDRLQNFQKGSEIFLFTSPNFLHELLSCASTDALPRLLRRSLGESSALSLGADYSLDPGGGGSAGGGSTAEDGLALAGGGKCSKEKNREAQRRFRERQKSLIGDLRETVNVLTREGQAQSKRIFGLQVS